MIVVGLKTRRDNGNDVIDEVRPVPAALITADRYRKVVREQVFPFVTDFAARWVGVADDRGLLVLDVPAQAERDKPFVVSGVEGVEGAPAGTTVAVPLRDDDGTHWLSRQDLQRLLSAGWNVTGPPEPRVVMAAAEQAPSVAVGEGDPLWTAVFRQAYQAAGGRPVLGDPLDVVTANGPGVFQHLTGDSRGPAAIFALPDHQPVILTGDLLRFLLKLCRDSSPADDAQQVGLPVADKTDTSGRRTVRLGGGAWGPGQLIQTGASGTWHWEPVPTIGRLWALGADRWSHVGTPESTPDLVLRVDAFLPWRGATGWSIDGRGRRRMLAALRDSELSQALLALSGRRGLTAPRLMWEPIDQQRGGWQSERSAQYSAGISASDDSSALVAEARLMLPDGIQQHSVQASAAIGVRLGGMQAGSDEAADLRVSVPELIKVFVAGWATATLVIPQGVVEDASLVPLIGPPRVELYVRAVKKHIDGVYNYTELAQLIDLSPFGTASSNQLQQGGITIVAPLGPSGAERQELVCQALIRIARQWGFIEVDDDLRLS